MDSTANRARAFTLVELLAALTIMSVLSVAIVALLIGAARTNAYVKTESDSVAHAEMALRRILHNLRTASTITQPPAAETSSTLTLATQPDSANSNATYTVTYALQGNRLTESDPRFNVGGTPSTIARNVSAFEVRRNSTTAPQTVTLTITIGTSSAVTRSVTVYCRNL
jgi:prepilin-type N-terminal cleavage/methylation domain-containing protein